jgi:hypothetical protein
MHRYMIPRVGGAEKSRDLEDLMRAILDAQPGARR